MEQKQQSAAKVTMYAVAFNRKYAYWLNGKSLACSRPTRASNKCRSLGRKIGLQYCALEIQDQRETNRDTEYLCLFLVQCFPLLAPSRKNAVKAKLGHLCLNTHMLEPVAQRQRTQRRKGRCVALDSYDWLAGTRPRQANKCFERRYD